MNSKDLQNFISDLQMRSFKYKENPVGIYKKFTYGMFIRMQAQLFELQKNFNNYHDIYCFFDRLSLGTSRTIYIFLDFKLQDRIFKDLQKYNLTLSTDKTPDFIDKSFTLVGIRNRVMHSNSLEIYILYYNERDRKFSDAREKRKKKTMVDYLKNENLYRKNPHI